MYLFLVNPEAGNRRFAKLENRIKAMLKRFEIKHRFVKIDDLADIPALLDKHLKPTDQAVIAVGGNATVNGVINALANRNVALGIVPMSRTNYLAQGLGVTDWRKAITILREPNFRDERLGKIGKHYFIGQVRVASRQNLLTNYLYKTSPLRKFLGLASDRSEHSLGVATKMIVDSEIQAAGEARGVEISLNGNEDSKRLRINLLVGEASDRTLLHGDTLTVESERKMPVIMGNETIAHTPIEVKGLTKHIKLIIPAEDKKLTAKTTA